MYKNTPKLAITIDVEASYPGAIEGVEAFLTLFKKYGIKSTFFITFEVLNEHPQTVSRIKEEGHEIASHGFRHFKATEDIPPGASYLMSCSKEEVEAEVEKSYREFEEKGYKVAGFRAPSFGMNESIRAVVAKYFAYDSSYIEGDLKLSPAINIPEFAVSRLKGLGIPLGSPYLFKLRFLQKVWKNLIPSGGLAVFYGHCYDFIKPDLKILRKSKIKKWWYHGECGSSAQLFYDLLISDASKAGFEFTPLKKHLEA